MEYKGWIPTISGRLSFGIVGETPNKSHSRVQCANTCIGGSRWIIADQTRYLSDSAVPFSRLLVPLLQGYTGTFHFVCIASRKADGNFETDELRGTLYIIDSNDAWRRAQPSVRDTQIELIKHEAIRLDSSQIEERVSTLENKLTQASRFLCDFSMRRSGVVTISTRPESEIPLPDTENQDIEIFRDDLCNQLFFFLKDITHIHQHHHHMNDTICMLYRCINGDDIVWRCKTLRSLYRKSVRFKRLHKNEDYCDALGVLSYTNKFRQICIKDVGLAHADDLKPALEIDDMLRSINASHEKLKLQIEDKIRQSENLRNLMVAIIGVVISFVGLLSLSGQFESTSVAPYLTMTANFALGQPIVLIAIVTSIVFTYDKGRRVANWHNLQSMQRLFQALDKRLVSVLFISIGIMMIVAAFSIVRMLR